MPPFACSQIELEHAHVRVLMWQLKWSEADFLINLEKFMCNDGDLRLEVTPATLDFTLLIYLANHCCVHLPISEGSMSVYSDL